MVAIGLLALGINKQMDLQTTLIQTGRAIAKKGHFYEYRLLIHYLFLGALLGTALYALAKSFQSARKFVHRFRITASGCACVGVYVCLRAISIDHLDGIAGVDLEQATFLWLLEIVGLILIISEAILSSRASAVK